MKSRLLFLSVLWALPLTAQTIDTARLHPIDEVVVSGKTRVKHMGRDVRSRFCAALIPAQTGAECGIACHAGKRALQLGMMRIWCYTQNIDTLVFRLRLYPMEKGKIGEHLTHTAVSIPIPSGVQLTEVDLRPYDLRVSGDFLLALECTHVQVHETEWQTWNGINIYSSLFSRSYFRTTDKPEWDVRKPGIGVSVKGHPVAR